MSFPTVNPLDIIRAAHYNALKKALDGTATFGQPILLTDSATSDYNLDVKNTSTTALTGGRALRVQTPSGGIYLRAASFGAGSSPVNTYGLHTGVPFSIGTDFLAGNHINLQVHRQSYATIDDTTYVTQYSELATAGKAVGAAIPDHAIHTTVLRSLGTLSGAAQNADGAGRVLEPHLFRYQGTGRTRDQEGMEMGVHVGDATSDIVSFLENPAVYDATFGTTGIWIHSDMGGLNASGAAASTTLGTGRRANTAVLLTGSNGWQNFIYCQDTDQSTRMFSVGKLGNVIARNVILAGATADNLAASPTYSFELDSNSGMYRISADHVGLAAGGALRASFDGNGFISWERTTIAKSELLNGVISPTQIAANTDNWNPTGLSTARIIRLTTDASRNLTGIVAQVAGTVLTLANTGSFDVVLVHAATSSAANQFVLPGSANLTVGSNSSVAVWYDAVSAKWRLIA